MNASNAMRAVIRSRGTWCNRPHRRSRRRGVGGALLVLTHPTAAYTDDAFRQGASVGYVLRYAILGLVGGLLLRAVRVGRRPGLAGFGLAVVLAAAIIPPALDKDSRSERRRAASTRVEDPEARRAAEFRAGAIDGCVDGTKRQIAGTPQEKTLDTDAYCTCYIDKLLEGPEDDEAQLRAAADALASGRPTRRIRRMVERCLESTG
jgi:hypothetical protein